PAARPRGARIRRESRARGDAPASGGRARHTVDRAPLQLAAFVRVCKPWNGAVGASRARPWSHAENRSAAQNTRFIAYNLRFVASSSATRCQLGETAHGRIRADSPETSCAPLLSLPCCSPPPLASTVRARLRPLR